MKKTARKRSIFFALPFAVSLSICLLAGTFYDYSIRSGENNLKSEASNVLHISKNQTKTPSLRQLQRHGKTPSLEMLREAYIYHVFDANGTETALCFEQNAGDIRPFNGGWGHTGYHKVYWKNDVKLPSGDIYVNCIGSGKYIALDDKLYVAFDSGYVEEASLAYDTILQTADGIPYDAADQGLAVWNDGDLPEPPVDISVATY